MILNNTIVFYFVSGIVNLKIFLVIIPLVIIVSILPLSVQGIGLRDVVAIMVIPIFLHKMPNAEIVLYSTIMNMLVIATSIIGGVIYIINKK